MNNASGMSAGFVLILVVLACTLVGIFGLGTLLDSRVIGGFVGGVVGVVAGFVTVYRMFLAPMRDASMQRDYSNLRPRLDDDD